MNETTREFLKIVSDIQGNELEKAAFNIREDSQCAGRQSTPNIKIDSKMHKRKQFIYRLALHMVM